MRSLEILDRDGARDPHVVNVGPLKVVAERAVEFVMDYIVSRHATSVTQRLRKLYIRREAQSAPQSPERRLLSRARLEIERVAVDFSKSRGLPLVVFAGAAVPFFGTVTQLSGAVPLRERPILLGLFAVGLLFSLALSWTLIQGAGTAHHRCAGIMKGPLADLWGTIGLCGNPPTDDSTLVAVAGILLTLIGWVLVPLALAALLVV
jgi:hypothetical protein